MADDFLSMAHMQAGLEEAIRERDEALAARAEAFLRCDIEFTKLRALLREWWESVDECPFCGQWKTDHAPDCRLKAALEG